MSWWGGPEYSSWNKYLFHKTTIPKCCASLWSESALTHISALEKTPELVEFIGAFFTLMDATLFYRKPVLEMHQRATVSLYIMNKAIETGELNSA